MLLAASLLAASCRKQDKNLAQPQEMVSNEEMTFSKASSGSNKKADVNTLDIDYDIVVKKGKNGRYKVGMRVHGLRTMGNKMSEEDNDLLRAAITNIVISINNTKHGAEVPLDIVLKSEGVNGKTYDFPEFDYKGDLAYELVSIKTSIKLKEGSIQLKDKSTFSFVGSTITVNGGSLELQDNSRFYLGSGSSITVNSAKVETNFAILFEGIGKGGSCDDENDYFLLPNGHSTEQAPTVKKVTFPKTEDGSVMRITISGDPAEAVESVWYTPEPYADPKDPNVIIKPEPIEFHRSEPSDKKIGICCYDRCVERGKESNMFCGTTSHFKPADFNSGGGGWARITMISAL
jgi:hypothetical protein